MIEYITLFRALVIMSYKCHLSSQKMLFLVIRIEYILVSCESYMDKNCKPNQSISNNKYTNDLDWKFNTLKHFGFD